MVDRLPRTYKQELLRFRLGFVNQNVHTEAEHVAVLVDKNEVRMIITHKQASAQQENGIPPFHKNE